MADIDDQIYIKLFLILNTDQMLMKIIPGQWAIKQFLNHFISFVLLKLFTMNMNMYCLYEKVIF